MKFFLMVILGLGSFQVLANASVKCKDGKTFSLIVGDNDPTFEAERKCKENKGLDMIVILARPVMGGVMMSPSKPSQPDQ